MRTVLRIVGVGVSAMAVMCCSAPSGVAAPAIAQYGEPHYQPGFSHFDYVNPVAPKRGTLTLANPSRTTRFDKFNAYTLRGNVAPGMGLLFDSLTVGSSDEPASAYGLLADDIAIAADGRSVRFHLNPLARFSNGDPVTAADVKYTFDTLMSKAAAPNYRTIWQDVQGATVLDRLDIRFDFKRAGRELPLLIGAMPVFSPKWAEGDNGQSIPFDQLALQKPIGSGPYVLASWNGGTQVVLQRNVHYWARDLPVRKGMFNFDRIVYKLYGDTTARLEAFKAGEFDANVEYRARDWVRGYRGRRFDDGELVKRTFKQSNDAGMQGFVLNLRRPLFQDVRVREALDLALDFQYLNRQLFYNQYSRSNSFFTNSPLAAEGEPNTSERALLEPLLAKVEIAADVLGPAVVQPTTTPPGSLRQNLLRARDLLAQAGWTYRDGFLRDRNGKPFEFDFLDDSGGSLAPTIASMQRNLKKLGIVAHYRSTDFALYQQRLQHFDFDVTTLVLPQGQTPGSELLDYFGSAAASEEGSNNYIGLRSQAVDSLITDVLAARSPDELVNATRALDRVLMHGYYVLPQWYSAAHRIAYKKDLAYPQQLPLFYAAEGWIESTWWWRATGDADANGSAATSAPAASSESTSAANRS